MGKGVKEVPNPKVGAPIYYLANFARKLHEKEKIVSRGKVAFLVPLDPPMKIVYKYIFRLL